MLRFEAKRDDIFGHPESSRRRAASWRRAKPLMLVAACALVDADSRVLLARRPEGKTMAGLWEFPGGKMLAGETPEHCLIRELKEELGIDVTSACLAPFAFASHAYARFHLLMPLYLCAGAGRAGRRGGKARRSPGCGRRSCPSIRCRDADKPLIPLLRDFL